MKNKELSSSSLWDLVAEVLTELSHRDKVDYRVKATEESVECFIDDKKADYNTWDLING
jgi:hypothetical protein